MDPTPDRHGGEAHLVGFVADGGTRLAEVARWSRRADESPNVAIVGIEGELCAFSAPEIGAALESVIDDAGPSLVLDLSAVRLVSAAGVSTLLDLRRRCHELGGAFMVRDPSDAVADLLDRVALPQLLDAVDARPPSSDPTDPPTSRRRSEHNARRHAAERDDLFLRAPEVLDDDATFAGLLAGIEDGCNVSIDASHVTTCTAGGLVLLVDLADQVEAHGGSVAVRGPSAALLAALHHHGLEGAFAIAATGSARARRRPAADRPPPAA